MLRALPLLAFFFAVDVYAFTGTLRFPDGAPCARCSVSILDHPATARADVQGRFELNPIPAPPFRMIVVSSEGVVYPTLVIASTTEPVITITPAHQESITVVSGVAPNIEAPPAAAAALIGREDLEVRAPVTVADAIASVPGATKSDAGPTAVPSIRGLARGRTLLLLDGARLSTERRAGSSATFVDPFSLASVELARGGGGVGYGSDAFGGVIELQSRYPEAGREEQVFYQLGGSAGGSGLATGGIEVSGGSEKHAWLLDLHARSGGDDETPDGRTLTTGFRTRGGALRYRGSIAGAGVTAAISVDEGRDIERPSVDALTRPTTYPIEDSTRFNAAADFGARLGFDRVRVEAFAGTYRLVLERTELAAGTAEVSDVDARDASLRVTAGHALGGGYLDAGYDFVTRFDLEATVDNVSASSAPLRTVAIDDASRTGHGLFASWNRPLTSTLLLGAGVRADAVRSANSGGWFGDHSADHVAPSGHVSLTAVVAQNTSATLQLSSGFRDPTLSDRYYRGPSGRGTIIGNPDLDPERSLQSDGALRWSRGASRVAVYGYHYTIRDLIERYRVGRDYFFRNRGEATLYGGEVEAYFPVARRLTGRAGVAIARGATSDGDDLDDVPAPTASLEVRWAHARGYVFGELRAIADDERPGPTELARDRYTTLDLGAGWRFLRAAELRIVLRNLTNDEHHASADEMSDLAAGRSITVMLSGTQVFQ